MTCNIPNRWGLIWRDPHGEEGGGWIIPQSPQITAITPSSPTHYPADERHSPNDGWMLGHRLRRWTNIHPSSRQNHVSSQSSISSKSLALWFPNLHTCVKETAITGIYSADSHTFMQSPLERPSSPLQRWNILVWKLGTKRFFKFEIIINVLVSSLRFIWIPMLGVYGHY